MLKTLILSACLSLCWLIKSTSCRFFLFLFTSMRVQPLRGLRPRLEKTPFDFGHQDVSCLRQTTPGLLAMLFVFTCVFQVKWKGDTCYMVAGRRGVFWRQTECRFLWRGGKGKDVEGRGASRWRDAGNNDLFANHECYCSAGVNATRLAFSGWLLEHVNTHLPLHGRGGCHDKAHACASFYFFSCPFLFLNSLRLMPSSFRSCVFCVFLRVTEGDIPSVFPLMLEEKHPADEGKVY